MRQINLVEGKVVAPQGMKVGIVAARFNEIIVNKLLGGAVDGLVRHGVEEENITAAWVPGAFEIPLTAQKIFLLYFIAMFGTIWLWSICSVILCTLLRNMWAGIGCLFGIVIGLISKAGSSFFGNLGLFSFSFCEPTQLMSESWIYGTLVSFIAGLFLFAVLPMTLKKRG